MCGDSMELNNKILRQRLHLSRQENEKLKSRVKELETRLSKYESISKSRDEIYKRLKDNSKPLHTYNNYFEYRIKKIKSTAFFDRISKILKISKGSLIATKILKYVMIITSFVETSAYFIIFSTVSIVTIPVFLVVSLITLIFGLGKLKGIIEDIIKRQKADKIYVFVTENVYGEETYLTRLAQEYSEDKDSPTRMVINCHAPAVVKAENLIVVKRSFYFHLKRKYLKSREEKTVYVY